MSYIYAKAYLVEGVKSITKELVETENLLEATHAKFYGREGSYKIKSFSKDCLNDSLSIVFLDRDGKGSYEYTGLNQKDLTFFKEVKTEVSEPNMVTLQLDEKTAKIIYALSGCCNTISQERTQMLYLSLKEIFGAPAQGMGIKLSQYNSEEDLNITINFQGTL